MGNQLFPLMKAYTFAYLNKLPVIVTDYNQVKIGPYLRREKTKRNYSGYFTFQKSILSEQLDKLKLGKFKDHQQEIEPPVKMMAEEDVNCAYIFSAMPHWDNYFDGLMENRDLVIELLSKLISADVLEKVKQFTRPCIGVHIRMGDFRKLKEHEDFSKVGAVRTPEKYFIEVINSIRKIHGTNLPVSVFTDGFRKEFEELFTLNNICLVEGNSDIVDLLLLSRSKIIVTSAGSTFSYWAGFLSEACLIMHPAHVNTFIRPANVSDKLYQGAFDPSNSLLVNSIMNIL